MIVFFRKIFRRRWCSGVELPLPKYSLHTWFEAVTVCSSLIRFDHKLKQRFLKPFSILESMDSFANLPVVDHKCDHSD